MFGRMKASIVMSQGASIARDQLEIKIEYVHAGATSVRNAMMREITRNKIMEINLKNIKQPFLCPSHSSKSFVHLVITRRHNCLYSRKSGESEGKCEMGYSRR